jgi:hypothetical protein
LRRKYFLFKALTIIIVLKEIILIIKPFFSIFFIFFLGIRFTLKTKHPQVIMMQDSGDKSTNGVFEQEQSFFFEKNAEIIVGRFGFIRD